MTSDGRSRQQLVTRFGGHRPGCLGNVLSLALRLGVPVWVAPLVAPAFDLSILGLLLGPRHLALTGQACGWIVGRDRLHAAQDS